jgi:hypothetical protein
VGLSPYLSGGLLAASLGGPAFQFGDPPYLALVTAPVQATDLGSTLQEPAYAGYERVALPWEGWTLDPSNTMALSPQIALPPYQSGPSAQIVGWAICDAPAAGDWGWSGLCTPFVIDVSDPAPTWSAGAILVNLASAL